MNDLRLAVRGLSRDRLFTVVAAGSLALGIMGVTAIYSVVHAVVIDPFAYKDVDRLTSVRVSNAAQGGGRTGYTVDQFLEIAERSRIFDGVIASTISDVLWTGDGDPRRLRGNHGTFSTFDVMGVPALVGRTPTTADAAPGAEPVAVLGYRFWQREFGGDPGVLGRRLRLNDIERTVIGVMPRRFMWRGADVYLPLHFQRGRVIEGVRSVHLLARLKPGVTDAQAQADLAPIIADLQQRDPTLFPERWKVGLLPFTETFRSDIARDVWVLLGAVGLLLLIACANVSSLLLSRAAGRQREMTVRAALGAKRGRLIRQLLTESLVLSLGAAALGTLLAYAGLPAILALVPPGTIPDEAEVALNGPVLAFALAVAVVTSVACGLMPALHSSRRDLAASMRDVGRGMSGSARQARWRKAVVVGEIALALVLLGGSSALMRAFIAMQHVPLNVAPEQVLTLRVPLAPQRYPDAPRRIAFFRELLERIAAVPGVASAGIDSGLHPLGGMWTSAAIAGQPPDNAPVQVHQVSAGYTTTLAMQLASGRFLTDADVNGVQPVALVNEQFVRARLGGGEALGQVVTLPRLEDAPFSAVNVTFTVTGVVRDTPNNGLTEPVMPEIYVPFTAAAVSNLVVVRSHGDPAGLVRSVAGQVYAIDRGQPVTDVKTLDALLRDEEFATPRFNLVLLSVFAGLGLILSVVGVYGVMASAVAQERREIGIRVALGAEGGAIARMVLARGFRLLAGGIVVGAIGSAVAGRMLAGAVWRIASFDPFAIATVSAILLSAGLAACAIPARRATRVDPMIALRHE